MSDAQLVAAGSTTKLNPDFGVADWLRVNADKFPATLCFIDEGSAESFTFAQTNQRVNQLADSLTSLGLTPGQRIAVLANDSHRYMEVLLASMKLGTCYVCLNNRLAPFELQNLVAASGAEWMVVGHRYLDVCRDLVTNRGRPLRLICLDRPAEGTLDYEALVAAGADREPARRADDEDIIGLSYTSGTTGLPKGVLQSQRMMKSLTMNMLIDCEVRRSDCRYTAAPLFHIAGIGQILMGVALGFPNILHPQFEPAKLATWLAEGRLTTFFAVPTMLSSLLEQPGIDEHSYDRLRSIVYGAAPMPPTLLRRAIDVFQCDFIQTFGAGTEGGMQGLLTPEDHRRALDGNEHILTSIGRASFAVDLRLCDDDLRDVPRGMVGEIVTRSDTVMSGYEGNPEATADACPDGWFRAGDLARMDDEGYIYLAGRKKDMIIRGGENVYPIEIETVLSDHPAVLEVSVVGNHDDHWGEIVVAHLVCRKAMNRPDDDDLRAWCRAKLAGYKVPAIYTWHEVLPKNAGGKVLKRELRDQGPTGAALVSGPEV